MPKHWKGQYTDESTTDYSGRYHYWYFDAVLNKEAHPPMWEEEMQRGKNKNPTPTFISFFLRPRDIRLAGKPSQAPPGGVIVNATNPAFYL
jgi:hypothetical protein